VLANLLLIFIGGGVGACLRWLLTVAINTHTNSSFPFGTLVVNLLGCLLIGLLAGFFEHLRAPTELTLFIITGILGGFTTFSSFGLETVRLLRSQHFLSAAIYVVTSNVAGLALAAAGYARTHSSIR
jgi:CrcB protein